MSRAGRTVFKNCIKRKKGKKDEKTDREDDEDLSGIEVVY